MKLNEERVKQLQQGDVVLYTGDKKGSKEVIDLLREAGCDDTGGYSDFYGKLNVHVGALTIFRINNRPIYPVEWFYASSEWISVKDRLPNEFENVLFYIEPSDTLRIGSDSVVSGNYRNKSFKFMYYEYNLDEVKFWQPLPTKPNY